MNTCILMAQVVRKPELRYTQDNQTPLTTMLVQFDGSRPEDPPSTLKVVAWGENLAPKVEQEYVEGDRVIIKGSLRMEVIDRQDFKEKRAELNVSEIYLLSRNGENVPSTTPVSSYRADNRDSVKPTSTSDREMEFSSSDRSVETVPSRPSPASNPNDRDLDDIPFVRSVDRRIAREGLLDFYEVENQRPQEAIGHNFKLTIQ